MPSKENGPRMMPRAIFLLSDDHSGEQGSSHGLQYTDQISDASLPVCKNARIRVYIGVPMENRIRMMAYSTPSNPHHIRFSRHICPPNGAERTLARGYPGSLSPEATKKTSKNFQVRFAQDAALTEQQHGIAMSSNGRAMPAVIMEMHRGRQDDPGLDRCTFGCSRPRLVRNRHALRSALPIRDTFSVVCRAECARTPV
jgi:hypothetical protein